MPSEESSKHPAGVELFADRLREYCSEEQLEKMNSVNEEVEQKEPETVRKADWKGDDWRELPRQYGISYIELKEASSGKEILVERDGKKAVYFVSDNEVELRSPQAEEIHGEGWATKTTSLLRVHFT